MKKPMIMAAALVLALAMAISGTIAYLTDTDSDVNVMTLGNVKIDQIEVGSDGKPFQDGDPLYPVYYPNGELDWSTVEGDVYKKVTVDNIGSSDAYVRTWFAFEAGNLSWDEFEKYILLNLNDADASAWEWSWDKTQKYSIKNQHAEDGNYFIALATLKEPLKKGETTEESLIQLAMAPEAGNEVVEAMGSEYVVLVLSQAMQTVNFEEKTPAQALAIGFGDEEVVNGAIGVNHPWEDGFVQDFPPDKWDGTVDTSWYNDTDTEFMIMTAEQLAGFAELVDGGNTFAGKTVKLGMHIDLRYVPEGETASKCFNPIGSYRNDTPFKGTFDGQNHTISNMSQNTWALNNGYYYGDLGLGLFGNVEDAIVKDLVMDNASISGESAICGTVAATAYGDCTFENITVKNSEVADYQYYAGGIVGWASGDHRYINCNVDASTTIAAQWGDFDNSVGGVIGGAGGSATILLKDCKVACRIDAYNDVTSTYRWYAYRRCGMLIGNTSKTVVVDGTTYAAAPQLTCENVTVTYDDWANYTYCEFAGTSWPYVRVQAGVSNSAYSNPRYGHPTDANGNEVVDDNHVHNDGEDHFIECTFDQLYGGGQGVYGDSTHDGVTVIYNNK